MSADLVLYTYSGCDTCRRAVKWLRTRGLNPPEKPIRATPPSVDELRRMLAFVDGKLLRLFNTAGQDYRALDLKTTLPDLGVEAALDLLANNGNLVKRPFLLAKRFGLVGFDEERWSEALREAGVVGKEK